MSNITELPHDVDTINTIINEKILELKKIRQGSLAKRHREMDDINYDSPASKSKGDPRRKRMKRAEIASRTWSTLNTLTSNSIQQQLDRLDVPQDWPPPFTDIPPEFTLSDPKTATEWVTITDPASIEYYLLLRNRLHFGQAQGTPFTITPLNQDINWGANSQQSDKIQDGTYIPSHECSPLCQQVIRALQRKPNTFQMSTTILTPSEFKGKITRWRETTTTSPSGRHLGWYKALYAKGIYFPATSDEALYFQSLQNQIQKAILSLINVCIRTGYVLQRWHQVTNVMIFKEINNYCIRRLRIIHIYEADLKILWAVKWRQLLHHADQQQIVNLSQYSGRPGCEATTPALMEESKIDISRMSRRTLITFDNVASSCYDRIIPSLASQVHRKYGLPVEITRLHGNVLQNTKYRLCTSNGLSESHYSHHPHHPIYGTGQGSGNSPVIWLLISATLFDTYEQNTTGATFETPDRSLSTTIHITGFVDDTNTSLNSWTPNHQIPTSHLLPVLCREAQCWNNLLYISGGKLELPKCSFHILEFMFDPDGTPRAIIMNPHPIHITDSVSGQSIEITPLSAATPQKTLGHWKAPSGTSKTQLQAIITKTKKISLLISTSPIPRYGACLAYTAKYLTSLRYVLPQCHFAPKVL